MPWQLGRSRSAPPPFCIRTSYPGAGKKGLEDGGEGGVAGAPGRRDRFLLLPGGFYVTIVSVYGSYSIRGPSACPVPGACIMELNQLQYFRTVARLENISKAAELLHITQPALSKSISRLEAEIGADLFERSENRIRLSVEGRAFLERVDLAVTQLKIGVDELQSSQSGERGHVHVASFSPALVSAPIREYMEKHPRISVRHSVLSQEQLRTGLEHGDIDVAITIFEIESPLLNWRPLAEDELIVLCEGTDPLAHQPAIRLADLRGRRIALNDATNGMRLRMLLESCCAKAGFMPDICYEGPDGDISMALLQKKQCVFVIPASIHIWKVQYDHASAEMGTQEFKRPFPFTASRIVDPVCSFRYGISVSRERMASAPVMDLYQTMVGYFESWNTLHNSERFEQMLLI